MPPPHPDLQALTTLHVHRAKDGDGASLDWLVARVTPLLLAQARRRVGPQLARKVDPEDVVQDVWAIALPRLPQLAEPGGRATPTLMRFLASTLLYRVNDLLRRSAVRAEQEEPRSTLPEATRGPLQRALESEISAQIASALQTLADRDQELIVLRLIEQNTNAEVARLLDLKPNSAAQAYGRALERLRERVTDPLLDELEERSV
jgi:RNA polymerase sigma-70 factor (ECF subfamily)